MTPMLTRLLTSSHLRGLGRASGLIRDERGIAAAEFSIIAPMMVGLYFGLAELSLVMSVERQVSHSASVAGDMVAQVAEVDGDDIADILAATLRVSQVRDAEDYVIRLTSYEMEDGSPVDVGSAIYNVGREDLLSEDRPEDFGPELLSESSGVVVATVAYAYTPMGLKKVSTRDAKNSGRNTYLDPSVTLRETFMLKPRRSTSVKIGDGEGDRLTCSGFGSNLECAGEDAPPNSTAG